VLIRFLLTFLVSFSLTADSYEKKAAAIFDSLEPTCLTKFVAFHFLYGDTCFGEKAFQHAWELINAHRPYSLQTKDLAAFPLMDIEAITKLITKQPQESLPILSNALLKTIEHITNHFGNRKLKGYTIWDTASIVHLPVEEIDLARAIFLYQFGSEEVAKIRTYEAYIDLMALQILAKLPKKPQPVEVIEAINQFVFHELGYRFPPHSMWAKDVDLYTFLPAVLDSRQGVCLGVSILYLSLAQRLEIPLQIITPPGHIYLCYHTDDVHINIETTARGIHMADEMYLGIGTKALQTRSIKEVLGLHFMNAAGNAWHKEQHHKAIEYYKMARSYLLDDPLLNMFLGFNLLFIGKENQAYKLLAFAKNHPPEELIAFDSVIEDWQQQKVDIIGIKTIYETVDETRESILRKQKKLLAILESYPEFREGLFHLAITWLQLGRNREAVEILDRYHAIDTTNPSVEYYLAILSLQRFAYAKAYIHFQQCERLLQKHHHFPKSFISLQEQLRKTASPL